MWSFIKGQLSGRVFYPLAEKRQKRQITEKLTALKQYYAKPFRERKEIAKIKLIETVRFAATHVPYYQDLLKSIQFDVAKLEKDIAYFNDIPFVTKDIIREQKERLFSRPLDSTSHHLRKTGGSTGPSCFIYYDDIGLDHTAAVTLFSRFLVGKPQTKSELHFAARFPEKPNWRDQLQETMKCLAMNRTNIFFDRLDDHSLNTIWKTIKRRKPYLVHAHPSTMYALACFVYEKYGKQSVFSIFESSGELMEVYMREKIAKTFSCTVIDRYGLAEFGIIAYQTHAANNALFVFDSEGWIEGRSSDLGHSQEIVFTGFHNRLMPLLRYTTGDLGMLTEAADGFYISELVGRTHDIIAINDHHYATHYVQDILDRVGGIQEFQIDLRHDKPKLLIVPEASSCQNKLTTKIYESFARGFDLEFIERKDLIRVGMRSKFRHVVQP